MEKASTSVEAKLDALAERVAEIAERQRKRDELFEEMTPILKEVMGVGTDRLAELESKGYFAMGKGLLEIVDRIVENYTADDVAELADGVVSILDAVRAITQPSVMAIAQDAAQAVDHADQMKPLGVRGMVRASRDEEVQRGMSAMMEVMRRVGRGAAKADRQERLRALLGPRRQRAAAVPRARQLPAGRAAAAPTPAAAPAAPPGPRAAPPAPQVATPAKAAVAPLGVPNIPGVEFTPEGFMVDASQWTHEIGEEIAKSIGCAAMTEAHWKLIDFARKEYLETHHSANLRRLSKGSGVGTKEIYAMFPKSPGKCVAMIAGVPKPVGCI